MQTGWIYVAIKHEVLVFASWLPKNWAWLQIMLVRQPKRALDSDYQSTQLM